MKLNLLNIFENGDLDLYNLKDDIGEKNNLTKDRPDKLDELKAILEAWRTETNAPVPTELNPEYIAL